MVKAEEIDLSFEIHGEGYPIVFLHGFCETKKIWNSFIRNQHLDSFQKIIIDLPGHGLSKASKGINLEKAALAVHHLLEYLSIKRFALVGHSMGFYVALEYIRYFQQEVESLICFHSHPFGDDEMKKQNRDKALAFVKNHGSAAFIKKTLPNLFAANFAQNHRLEIVGLVNDFVGNIPKTTVIDYLVAMRDRSDRSSLLSKYPNPVCFIIGENDKTADFELLIKQTILPAISKVYIGNQLNHMGMLTAANKSAKTIADFIHIGSELTSRIPEDII